MVMFKHAPETTLLYIAYTSKSVQMWRTVLATMREKLEPKEVRPFRFCDFFDEQTFFVSRLDSKSLKGLAMQKHYFTNSHTV